MDNHADSGDSGQDAPVAVATSHALTLESGDPTDGLPVRIYVVTACRNSGRTIGDTLDSVVSQLEYVERHVIVDGASTDDTIAVIEQHVPSYGAKLTVISEPDEGIYHAMNKGLRVCLQEAGPRDLVATLNADDRYEPDALRVMGEAARREPSVDVFYGDLAMLDEAGRPTGVTRDSVSELSYDSCSDGMPIEHPTMFVRAHVYGELGLYDESYSIAADYEFVLRLAERGVRATHVGATITGFRFGGVSTTSESASFRESIRARVAHGASPAFEWLRYGKRRAFGRMFASIGWIPGLATLQSRYGASARHAGRGRHE